jgi:hypothetical protein
MTNPITPPPELVQQWWAEETYDPFGVAISKFATQAAQWGADQELDAGVNYIDNNISGNKAREFRAIRRPKPPSLKEQALAALHGIHDQGPTPEQVTIIRRALEQLDG